MNNRSVLLSVCILLCLSLHSQHEVEIQDIDSDGDAILQMTNPQMNLIYGFNQSSGGFVRTISNHDLYFETTNIERMRISNEGNVGINTSNPIASLNVRDTVIIFSNRGTALSLESNNSHRPTITWLDTVGGTTSTATMEFHNFDSPKGLHFSYNDTLLASLGIEGLATLYHKTSNLTRRGVRIADDTTYWDLHVGPSAITPFLEIRSSTKDPLLTATINLKSGEYNAISDERTKKNFTKLTHVLSSVSPLNAWRYEFKNQANHEDKKHIGFVAQELKELFPELVHHEPNSDRFMVNYNSIGVLAIAALQEQQKQIEELKTSEEHLSKALSELKGLANTIGINK